MAKPQTKKTLETFNQELAQVHMTGQWIYEDLLNRAIGGPRPRGDAYLWPWAMVHEKLLEACDVLEESFTARRSVLFGNPGLNDNATTHTLLDGHSDDQARRNRLGASPYAGGDSLRHQRRRQSFHRGRRREMPDGALRFDSHAAMDLARSPAIRRKKPRSGWMLSMCRFCLAQPALLRTLSRETKFRPCGRKPSDHLQQRAVAPGRPGRKPSKENFPAPLCLERYRAAAARAGRSTRQSLRRRRIGVRQSDDRRTDAADYELLDSVATTGRTYEKPPAYFERSLFCRRRRGHDASSATRRWNGTSMTASRFPIGRGMSILTVRRVKRRFYFPSTIFRLSRLSISIARSRKILCTRRKRRKCRR